MTAVDARLGRHRHPLDRRASGPDRARSPRRSRGRARSSSRSARCARSDTKTGSTTRGSRSRRCRSRTLASVPVSCGRRRRCREPGGDGCATIRQRCGTRQPAARDGTASLQNRERSVMARATPSAARRVGGASRRVRHRAARVGLGVGFSTAARLPTWRPPRLAIELPTALVAERPMSRNVSTPRISSRPASGMLNWFSVAAITTSEARGTPAMPLEVSIRISSIVICVRDAAARCRRPAR